MSVSRSKQLKFKLSHSLSVLSKYKCNKLLGALAEMLSCISLRWLYNISSVFAGRDIYIFLDVLILSAL